MRLTNKAGCKIDTHYVLRCAITGDSFASQSERPEDFGMPIEWDSREAYWAEEPCLDPELVINLTQHAATPTQRQAGVRDVDDLDMPLYLPGEAGEALKGLLTIPVGGPLGIAENSSAAGEFLDGRAASIVSQFVLPILGKRAQDRLDEMGARMRTPKAALEALRPEYVAGGMKAMVGGAPYLTERLARELRKIGVEPVYALSDRVSKEVVGEDGTVTKTQVFEHLGFIQAI